MKEIDKELWESAQEALLVLSEYTLLNKHLPTLDRLARAIEDFEVREALSGPQAYDASP